MSKTAIPHAIFMVVVFLWFSSGLFFGLPQQLDPDESIFVRGAAGMLAERSPDPGWYGAPAQFLMYLLAAAFGAVAAAGLASGAFASLGEVPQAFYDDPTRFFVAGRVLAALAATLCVPVIFAICRRLALPPFWCWLCVAAFAASPLILGYASLIRMDYLQILFNLLTVLLCMMALQGGRARRLLVAAGACVGLAVTNKFTGLVGALPVVATAIALVVRRDMGAGAALLGLVLAGLASLAAAFVTGPFLFLHMQDMLAFVASENRGEHLSQTNSGLLGALRFYLVEALPDSLGWPLGIAAVAGLLGLCLRGAAMPLVVFFAGYLLFISSLNLLWLRWILPLVPVAAIAGAWALAMLERRLAPDAVVPGGPVGTDGEPGAGMDAGAGMGARRRVAALRAGAAIVLLAPMLAQSLPDAAARLGNSHTRVIALDWVQRSLPEGTTLLVETYAPSPSVAAYDVRVVAGNGRMSAWEAISRSRRPNGFYGNLGIWSGTPEELSAAIDREGVGYVLLSDWQDRYAAERERYAREAAIYDHLQARYPVAAEFRAGGADGARFGETIRILRAGAD